MSSLFDLIDKKPMLKRLYNMLELGISTIDLKLLLPYLNDYQVNDETITADIVTQFREHVNNDMASKDYSLRDVLGIGNIISIYGIAAVIVQAESVPGKDLEMDFAMRFYDYARTCSDSDKQSLSGKILANELIKPQTYFLRTLDAFFKADKFELEWFFEATKYIYDQACVPEFVLTDNKFYPYNQFQTLIDAGFVNSSSGTLSYGAPTTMHFSTADVNIEIPKPPFGLSVYTLTDAGAQLFDLRPEAPTDEFLNKLKEMLERNNLAKVVSIDRK